MSAQAVVRSSRVLGALILISSAPVFAQQKTVGDLLRKIEKKAQTVDIRKGSSNLPQFQNVRKVVPKSKGALQSIKPPSSSSLLYSKDQDQRELERVTDAGIRQLFTLTKRFGTSSRRGELWLRLAELYVEKAKLIEFRLQEDYDKKSELYQQGKTKVRPKLNLKPAQEYNAKAVKLYEWFVRDFPKDPKMDQALFFLGFNYVELNQIPRGLGFYKRLVQEYPRSPFVEEAQFALGEYYFDNEKFADAYKAYQAVAKNEDGRLYSFAMYKSAWSLYKNGQAPSALKIIERVILTGRRSKGNNDKNDQAAGRIRLAGEALKDLVAFYAEVGSPENAREYFTRVAGEKSADKMIEKLAYYYVDTGNRQGARALFADMIKNQPMAPKAYDYQYQIVTFFSSGGDEKTFREELFNWIERYGPESAWARANAKNKELTEKSQQLIETTLRNFILQSHQVAQTAKTDAARKQAQQGYDLYFNSFKNAANIDEMHFFYAELLYDMKMFDKAGEQYAWVVDHAPKSKYFEKANLNSLLAMEKKLPTPEEIKGIVGTTTQPIEFDANVKLFERMALKYFQDFPKGENVNTIRYRLASLYYYYNQFDPAITLFRDVIRVEPKSQSAEYSANLILDIYSIRKDFDGLTAAADDLLKVPGLSANPKLREQIQKIKERTSFKMAQNLEQENNHEKAAVSFEGFAIKNAASPLSQGAFFNAAVNYEKAQKPAKAIEMYMHVIGARNGEKNSDDLKKRAQLFLPTLFERTGQYRRASEAFEAYIKKYPKEPQSTDFFYNVAIIQDGLNMYDAAVKNYHNYIGKSKKRDRFECYYLLGRLWERRRNPYQAIEAYQEYINSPVATPRVAVEASFRIAKLYESTRSITKAKEAHQKVVRMQKKLSSGDKTLGASNAAESQFTLVYPTFTELRNIRIPTDPSKQGGSIQMKLNLINRLKEQLKQVIAYDDGPMVVASLALQGQALQHMASSIQSAPMPKGLSAEETKAYREGVEKLYKPFEEQSVESYKKALEKGFELQGYNSWIKMAAGELAKLRPKEYPNYYGTVVPVTLLDPLRGYGNADYKKIDAADNEGELAKAAEDILSNDPKDVRALNAMALFYIERKNYGMARMILQRAIKDRSDLPGLQNNVAVTYAREGEDRKALSTYLEALKIKPDYFFASANMATVQAEHYDYQHAQSPLQEAYHQLGEQMSDSNQSAQAVANNYGVTLAGLGKGPDAEVVFGKMMEKDIRLVPALLNYSTLLVDTLNNKEKAGKIIARLKYLTEDKEILKRAQELEKKLQ